MSHLSSCGSVEDMRTGSRWFKPAAWPILTPRIYDSHWGRIYSSLIAVHFFDDGNVGKQPVARKEYCAKNQLKELQESMARCTGHRDITEMTFKTALNIIQSII